MKRSTYHQILGCLVEAGRQDLAERMSIMAKGHPGKVRRCHAAQSRYTFNPRFAKAIHKIAEEFIQLVIAEGYGGTGSEEVAMQKKAYKALCSAAKAGFVSWS